MLSLLVINHFGKAEIVSSKVVPSAGDKVDLFYNPKPIVQTVMHWPSEETLKSMNINQPIDAIVTVK